MADRNPYTQTNSPTFTYSPCIDINGKVVPHGRHYIPPHTPCSKCMCHNGLPGHPDRPGLCILVSCPKPKCQKYKRMPGKCCDYKCEDKIDSTDKATLAIVIALSIVLVFTLIAITFVLRKIRRNQLPFTFAKKFTQRLSPVSSNSQTQLSAETNVDEVIQKHSIPNNLRQPTSSKAHPVLSYCHKPDNTTKLANIDNTSGEKGTSKKLNYSNDCSTSSLLSGKGSADMDANSVDGSAGDTKFRQLYDERPSVHSPLLSTAFI